MSNFDILDRLMQHELEGRAVAASEECYALRRHIASLQAKIAELEEQNAELRAHLIEARAMLDRACNWIDQEPAGMRGPAEDAAHTRMIEHIEARITQIDTFVEKQAHG